MPWNFPLWQVFRFAAPTLMAGNTAILKHASNVSGCSDRIEQLFTEAGFPKGVFQSTITDSSEIEGLISNDDVAAVTITGSTDAGIKVSRSAGENLKKIVLELGGNDPYIILEDADIDLAVQKCSDSRLLNNGQSCIAAKRFIVHAGVYDDFIKKLKHNFESKKIGDPTDSESDIGPMAREDLRQELHDIVIKSIELGAKVITGAKIPDRTGFYYPPTILTNVTKIMPAYSEELFGPVACVYKFDKLDEAVEIANDTDFGLGGGVFSKDIDEAVHIATKLIKTGNCAVNDFVKSNPLLPFGGIKKSGYGRELSENGIKEFVNIKTITVRRS
jgi:succinate-semialdehyde dehydrogenase/glutarate-semialdehyde dehydrogenase